MPPSFGIPRRWKFRAVKQVANDRVSYKWMTIAEMEADDRIMEVNKDVVSFVKEKIE